MELWRLKNTDTRIVFPICDADGDPTSNADDNTPDSEWVSWDTADHGGGAPSFADCTHEYVEIAGGFYYLDIQAAEINKDFTLVQLKTALAGCKTQAILIRTYVNSNEDLHGHLATIDGHITADYGSTEKAAIDLLDDASGGLVDIHTDVAAVKAETATIVADTNELQTDLVNGGRLDLLVDAIKAKTDNLPASPAAVGSAMLITAGTGAGQLAVTSGVIKANLAQILGTALTETAGQIAASFKKVFDVGTPVFTAASVNQTGDAYAKVDTEIGTLQSDVTAIKAKTDMQPSVWYTA